MRGTWTALFAALTLSVAPAAFAKHEGKGHSDAHPADHGDKSDHGDKGKGDEQAAQPKKKKYRGFKGNERSEISGWFKDHPDAWDQLPPGLAKQHKIPPGWQKKLQHGHPVPDDLWALRVPLPHEVLIKLGPPPPGVVLVRIHDHVVRAVENTHEVLDHFGLPHPPNPR